VPRYVLRQPTSILEIALAGRSMVIDRQNSLLISVPLPYRDEKST
jgi:hypothetical protein